MRLGILGGDIMEAVVVLVELVALFGLPLGLPLFLDRGDRLLPRGGGGGSGNGPTTTSPLFLRAIFLGDVLPLPALSCRGGFFSLPLHSSKAS